MSNTEMKKSRFFPIKLSSKFGICGLGLVADTYRGGPCHGCTYCFALNREIMPTSEDIAVADIDAMARKLASLFEEGKIDPNNMLDVLLVRRMTIHLGSMSDALQDCEEQCHATHAFVELTKKYHLPVLVSTKAASTYGVDFDPHLHSFQLSISNIDDRSDIEANVPTIKDRRKFFEELKAGGFRVGIRLQPYIPGISSPEVVDMFSDADHFVIEAIKIVPQDPEYVDTLLTLLQLDRKDFKQKGLLTYSPEKRLREYAPVLERLDKYGIRYNIADNDLRFMGTDKCCCGDSLVQNTTDIDTTALIKKHGLAYTKDDLLTAVDESGCGFCRAKQLFASNRQNDGDTVSEILATRYDRKVSPVSPKYMYTDALQRLDLMLDALLRDDAVRATIIGIGNGQSLEHINTLSQFIESLLGKDDA